MLQIIDLEVVYHSVISVLKGIDLIIPQGNVVALLGPNGAGKTTLIRAITGLLDIHNGKIVKGTISWMDEYIGKHSSNQIVKKGIIQVMEGRRIFADLTVEENLHLATYNRKDKEIKNDIDHFLDLFPILKERYKSLAGYLSGGEQQMLALARSLMSRPKLLLLDEPSLGLAPVIVAEMGKLIKKINQEGVTILLVEQNARLGLELSDYSYVLENGITVIEGKSKELLANTNIQKFYLGDIKQKSFKEAKYYHKRKSWLN